MKCAIAIVATLFALIGATDAQTGPPIKGYPSLEKMEVRADGGKTIVIAEGVRIVAPMFRSDGKSHTITFEAKGADWVTIDAPKMKDSPKAVKAKKVIVHLDTDVWEFHDTSGQEIW